MSLYNFITGEERKGQDVYVHLSVENGFLLVSCRLPGDDRSYRIMHISETGFAVVYENNPILDQVQITDSPGVDAGKRG